MEERIKGIQVYQSVAFNGGRHTSFSNIQDRNYPNREMPVLTYMKQMNAIKISNSRDHVIIPLTNVSAIYLYSKIDEERDERDKINNSRKKPLKTTEIKKPSK